jgi:glycine cleavage system H lipoate-binding protein
MTVLFMATTIVLFLGVDWLIRRLRARSVPANVPLRQDGIQAYPVRTPEGIYFDKSHTWINLFPSGKIRVGIDDFVGSVVDNPEITFMQGAGSKVNKGDPLVMLSQGDKRLIIRSPLSGEILSVNRDLEKNPRLMREKLFSNGWVFSLRPGRFEELRLMLLGEESRNWMQNEFRRLRECLAGNFVTGALAPALMQDGGAPVAGVLKHFDGTAWKRFEDTFLQIH